MDYWEKIESNPYTDLLWNVPEQKQGIINIIGGNSQSFNTEIRTSEFTANHFPIKEVKTILPDALKNNFPPLDNLFFLPSTNSGSFNHSPEFHNILNAADFNLFLGDLSKNSVTEKAILDVCTNCKKPLLITRDTVDLIANSNPEKLLLNEDLIIFASLPQLQKLFHAVYYPKVITLSMSLMQIVDAIHKFTLSYPVTVITFNNGQIIVSRNGKVFSIPLEKTSYSPITLWSGQLAAKIATLNLFNPNKFLEASICAFF